MENNQNKNKTKAKIKRILREEEEQRTKKIAAEAGLPYLDLSIIPLDPSGLNIIPLEQSKKIGVTIIQKFGKALKVAVKDFDNEATKNFLEELKKKGFSLKVFVVSQSSLDEKK